MGEHRSMRRRIGALALLAVLCPAGARAASQRPNVILIVLDAARADHFSCYGYPRATTPEIDRIAAKGMLFENHFANNTATVQSMPQLLYSRYAISPLPEPKEFGAIDLNHRFPDGSSASLPEVFAANGYETGMVSVSPYFSEGSPLVRQFSTAHVSAGVLKPATQVVSQAISMIRSVRNKPFFLYLHFMDTHFPHSITSWHKDFLPDYPKADPDFADGGYPIKEASQFDAGDRAYINGLYDGDLRFTDAQVGRLFRFLEEQKIPVVLAITADHGELLGEFGGRFEHGGAPADPLNKVPLIIYTGRPEHAGKRYSFFTESVDVLPTLVDLAGARVEGKHFDGVRISFEIENPELAKTRALTMMSIRNSSYMYTEGELYPVSEGRQLETNVAEKRPEVAALLRKRLDDARAEMEAGRRDVPLGAVNLAIPFYAGVNQAEIAEWSSVVLEERADYVCEEHPERWTLAGDFGLATPRDREDALTLKLKVPKGVYDVYAVASYGKTQRPVGGDLGFEIMPSTDVVWNEPHFENRGNVDTGVWPNRIVTPIGRLSAKTKVVGFKVRSRPSAECALLERFVFVPKGPKVPEGVPSPEERLRDLGYLR